MKKMTDQKSVKLKDADIIKKQIEKSKKPSALSNTKPVIVFPKNADIDIIATKTGKKFDISQMPSVSISEIKREKVDSGKRDTKKMNQPSNNKPDPNNDDDDDVDVICID